jgi:hypothetical protein
MQRLRVLRFGLDRRVIGRRRRLEIAFAVGV